MIKTKEIVLWTIVIKDLGKIRTMFQIWEEASLSLICHLWEKEMAKNRLHRIKVCFKLKRLVNQMFLKKINCSLKLKKLQLHLGKYQSKLTRRKKIKPKNNKYLNHKLKVYLEISITLPLSLEQPYQKLKHKKKNQEKIKRLRIKKIKIKQMDYSNLACLVVQQKLCSALPRQKIQLKPRKTKNQQVY